MRNDGAAWDRSIGAPWDYPSHAIRNYAFEKDVLIWQQLVDRSTVAIIPEAEVGQRLRYEFRLELARFMEKGTLRLPKDWKEGAREAWQAWVAKKIQPRFPKLAARIKGRGVIYKNYEALAYLPNLEVPPNQGPTFRIAAIWREK